MDLLLSTQSTRRTIVSDRTAYDQVMAMTDQKTDDTNSEMRRPHNHKVRFRCCTRSEIINDLQSSDFFAFKVPEVMGFHAVVVKLYVLYESLFADG